MSTPHQSGSMGDELTNILMAGLAALFGLVLTLRAAGTVAAFLTGAAQPKAGITGGLAVLFDPANPDDALDADGLNPVAYWITLALMLALLGAAGAWAWTLWRRHTRAVDVDPHHLAGTATSHEVATAASAKQLIRRATTLRPSLSDPEPRDVGFLLGQSRSKQVWASVEDSILLIGPPRSGKGLHIVIPAILDAPGAVVTTSTRPDNLTATLRARQKLGPVAVFDPQHLADGVPAGLRWSPIRGCEDPLTAMIRAIGLAAATGLADGGVDGGGFWEGKTRVALQALLHAAALDHRAPAELFRWTLDPTAAADAVAILTGTPRAATGWAESLEAMIDADPRARDSIWQGVSSPWPHSPTPESSTPSAPPRMSNSTPKPSSVTRAPCTCWPPVPGRATVPPWSPPSSKTSSKPPAASPPAAPGLASTRPSCSPSTRSATSHPCHPCPH